MSTRAIIHIKDVYQLLVLDRYGFTKTAELFGRGVGTAILRYKQSSLINVFGFHISAPEKPGYVVSGS